MKKTYFVKGYENAGKPFRRTTERDYTHAIVVIRHDNGKHFVRGYCSRFDLAQKLKSSTENYLMNKGLAVTVEIKDLCIVK